MHDSVRSRRCGRLPRRKTLLALAARAALGLASAVRPSRGPAPKRPSGRAAKEVADLRGQVAFLLASPRRRHRPWRTRTTRRAGADADGRIEFLFLDRDAPRQLSGVAAAWPGRRDAAARAAPGVSALLAAAPLSDAEFVRAVQGVYDWSRTQDPECRHYVRPAQHHR